MRKDKLATNQTYQNHVACSKQNPFYYNTDKSSDNLANSFFLLSSRINDYNTYVGRKMFHNYEYEMRKLNNRLMLFQNNFLFEFGYIEPVFYDQLFSDIEDWLHNGKAYLSCPVSVDDNDGEYIISGTLNVDSEMEDNVIIITKVSDMHLAKAIEIFMDWFHEEITHYEKQRYVC